jgi:hypothetical protein
VGLGSGVPGAVLGGGLTATGVGSETPVGEGLTGIDARGLTTSAADGDGDGESVVVPRGTAPTPPERDDTSREPMTFPTTNATARVHAMSASQPAARCEVT